MTKKKKKKSSQADQLIPRLLPLYPSEDASYVLEFEENDILENTVEENQDDLPLEWIIQVAFSRSFSERNLWKAFYPLLDKKWKTKKIKIQNEERMLFMGDINVQGLDGKDEVQLFVSEEFLESLETTDENHELSENKKLNRTTISPKLKNKPKKTKKKMKKKEPSFSDIILCLQLVSPSHHSEDDIDEDEDEKGLCFPPEILEFQDLELVVQTVKKCSSNLDSKAQVLLREDTKTAEKRANKLAEMVEDCDKSIGLILQHQTGFSGLDIWNVMLSLYLEFDAERHCFVFELQDDEEEEGFTFFAVSPNGNTKGFDAIELADPSYVSKQLVFSCYVPYCPVPILALKMMKKAADYIQSKLGGQLLNELEQPLGSDELEQTAISVLNQMKSCGLTPGSQDAMKLF